MKNSNAQASGSISFSGLLVILFVGLKLTGHISWSWWWVFSPFWLPLTILAGVLLIVFVCHILVALLKSAFSKRRYYGRS